MNSASHKPGLKPKERRNSKPPFIADIRSDRCENSEAELEKGKLYMVRHRSPSERYTRTSVMRFMGYEDVEDPQSTFWDGRPTFGTTELPNEWFCAALLLTHEDGTEDEIPYLELRT